MDGHEATHFLSWEEEETQLASIPHLAGETQACDCAFWLT